MKHAQNIILIVMLALFSAGCASSPKKVATQTVEVVYSSVDAAMQAWEDYVMAGYASQGDRQRCHDVYEHYRSSMMEAINLLTAWVSGATSEESVTLILARLEQDRIAIIELVQDIINTNPKGK